MSVYVCMCVHVCVRVYEWALLAGLRLFCCLLAHFGERRNTSIMSNASRVMAVPFLFHSFAQATLPGGESEVLRSAKQTEREILPGSSFTSSLQKPQEEKEISVEVVGKDESPTLEGQRYMSEEDLVAATHSVLDDTLKHSEDVIFSLQPEKEQVVDLVLTRSTLGLLDEDKAAQETMPAQDGERQEEQAVEEDLERAQQACTTSASPTLQCVDLESSNATDHDHNAPSPASIGHPIDASTPLPVGKQAPGLAVRFTM